MTTRRPHTDADLADSSDHGDWYCLTCGHALMYSAALRQWDHAAPSEGGCRRVRPQHRPDDRRVMAGRWP